MPKRKRTTATAPKASTGRTVARLDLTDRNRNAAGGAFRRSLPVETKPEDALTPQYKRNLTVAASRHAAVNLADMVAIRRALRVHVVGTMGKPFFREGDVTEPWFEEAERFFARWGRSADFRTGASWRECLQKLVVATACEGDVVAVFDDGILTGGDGSGRFAFFTADQIVPLCDGDFNAWRKETGHAGWTQTAGVLYDAYGRRAGVVVTAAHGATETRLDECFVLLMDPADPDAAPWRHVSRAFRFDQSRAIPDAAAAIPGMIDSDDIRLFARILTKRAQSVHGVLKHDFGAALDPRALDALDEIDEATGDDEAADGAEDSGAGETAAAGSTAAAQTSEPPAIPEFRGLSDVLRENTVGAVDVIDKNDDFTVTPQVSPNLNVPAYLDEELRHGARAFGLPALLATLKADNSYSSARAEIALAEEHFKDLRQFLEDAFSDWAAVRVFEWGMRTGRLSAAAPDDWDRSLAWQYPRLPFLDPQKEAASFVALYRAGLVTMEDAGIRREEVFASMARDKESAERHGVDNCSLFEAAPGAENGIESGGDGAQGGDGGDLSDEEAEALADQILKEGD